MADQLTGIQKAAILVTLLDEQSAAALLASLEESEVRLIAREIARVDLIDPSRYEAVLTEFQELVMRTRSLERAGPGKARRLIEASHIDGAERLLHEIDPPKIKDLDEEAPDIPPPELPKALLEAPSRRLAALLQDEPPQTVALVLTYLPSRKAGRLLSMMEEERRAEITRRMAGISEVRPEVVNRVGEILEQRLGGLGEDPFVPVDGVQTAADAITVLGRARGQEIVDSLIDDYPELASRLRDLLFTFEMVGGLNDRDTQEVLKQVDRSSLALALKGADPVIQEQFFRNMSERAASMLKEEMEFLGAPRVGEIEQAQRSIIELVLKLEKEGAITLEEESLVAG